jgi:hypothetical protein
VTDVEKEEDNPGRPRIKALIKHLEIAFLGTKSYNDHRVSNSLNFT